MNIVIIDDESVICTGLKRIVTSSEKDWTVVDVFTDPEEALEFCDWDQVDLLLADIQMAHIDGLTLVETLRRRGHDLQVIFISGYAQFDYAKKALQQKAVDYIVKPVSAKNVMNAILKAEEVYKDQKKQMRNEKFIERSMSRIRKSFIYDMVFETRRFKESEIEQNLKSCNLENKRFTLSCFAMTDDQVHFQPFIDKYCDDKSLGVYFFRSQRIYIIVLCEDKDSSSKIDLIMQEISSEFKGIIFEEAHTTENIYDLSKIYYDLMVGLNNNFNEYVQNRVHVKHEKDELLLNGEDNYSIHIIKAIEYIRQNYSKKISLAKLSEELYVHPTYLSNLFKKQTGFKVVDYINNYRIKVAMKLLEDSRNKIYWVTEQVGFANQRYFSQKFKELTGCTPVEFRQNYFFSCRNMKTTKDNH